MAFAFASQSPAETFIIAGGSHNFIEQDKLLLAGCEKKCEALNTIQKHTRIGLKEIRKGRTFSNSVGSDVCSQVYHMESVLGQALDRDRRAFCLFKDGSMVEMNSLSGYLTEKKIAF